MTGMAYVSMIGMDKYAELRCMVRTYPCAHSLGEGGGKGLEWMVMKKEINIGHPVSNRY
jgi:hypothetical protein